MVWTADESWVDWARQLERVNVLEGNQHFGDSEIEICGHCQLQWSLAPFCRWSSSTSWQNCLDTHWLWSHSVLIKTNVKNTPKRHIDTLIVAREVYWSDSVDCGWSANIFQSKYSISSSWFLWRLVCFRDATINYQLIKQSNTWVCTRMHTYIFVCAYTTTCQWIFLFFYQPHYYSRVLAVNSDAKSNVFTPKMNVMCTSIYCSLFM